MLKEKDLVMNVAKDVNSIGGTLYLVGGYVRDLLLNKDSKDIDVEVHGISPNQFKTILSKYGEVDEVGASFGVLMVKGFDIDFAMPRSEKKIGEGHKGFEVDVDPFMGTLNACKRRDFTINSLAKNVLTGEIIDHFNGVNDLDNGIISHVDNVSFVEDPLRVFRACQFASRFNFDIADDTMKLCSEIDITSLARERVLKELEKAILKSEKPSVFFYSLKKMNKLNPYFKELDDLNNIMFDYAMKQVDMLEKKSMESVLTVICYYLYDEEKFLNRFTNETTLIKNISYNINTLMQLDSELDIVRMRKFAYLSLKREEMIKGLVKVIASKDFYTRFEKVFDTVIEDVRVPLVTSQDLFNKGYKPGKDFGCKLKSAMEYQFMGYSKEKILDLI